MAMVVRNMRIHGLHQGFAFLRGGAVSWDTKVSEAHLEKLTPLSTPATLFDDLVAGSSGCSGEHFVSIVACSCTDSGGLIAWGLVA
jgi:hypothetical protein